MFQPLDGALNTSKKQEAREAYANIMAVKHATFKVNQLDFECALGNHFWQLLW